VHEKKKGRDGLIRSQEEITSEERKAVRAAKKKSRNKSRKLEEAEHKLASRINPGLGNPYEKRKLIQVFYI
jgi:U3 small nucleolar RNA-associated protein MPP10